MSVAIEERREESPSRRASWAHNWTSFNMPSRTHADLLDFIDTASVGLHWVGADGTILWANPADYEPLGYCEHEYVGRNITEFHADAEAIADILGRLIAGERLKNYRARLRCKDGSTREVSITSSVRFDESGAFQHTRCFTIDVGVCEPPESPERQLQRELAQLREIAGRERGLAEAIVEHSPWGIWLCNVDGTHMFRNRAAERIWAGHVPTDRRRDHSAYTLFHSDGRPFTQGEHPISRALALRHTAHPEEFVFERLDGTRGVLLQSCSPIFSTDGSLDGVVAMFVDVSTMKKQERDLRLSEERLTATLNSIADAVIATDADGRITFFNANAARVTEVPNREAHGAAFAEIFCTVDPLTREAMASPVGAVLREGTRSDLRPGSLLLTRNGRELAVEAVASPIFDTSSQVAGAVVVFRDISERQAQEGRRQFLAEASSLLSSSLDYKLTLTSVARLAVPEIADWCAVDMVADTGLLERLSVAHVDSNKVEWAKAIAARYPENPDASHGVYAAIRTGQSELLSNIPEELLVAAAADEEHLRIIRELELKSSMVVPLKGRDKILGAMTFVATDHGRRFSAEDLRLAEELARIASLAVENSRLYQDAQSANHAKDEFLATASHELRTPLHAILGWARLLRAGTIPVEKMDQALEAIERNSIAQARLIDDLLDVSRIISGKLRLDLQPLSLSQIVQAALDTMQPTIRAKGLALQVSLDADAGSIQGDPERLQQVLWNLLSNAVKFTPKEGCLTVVLQRVDAFVELMVRDTGQGMPSHLLASVFDRFKQADSSSSRVHGGLGLGLAIVRRLVEMHGGTVTAQSPGEGRGATFTVRLPVTPLREFTNHQFRSVSRHQGRVALEHPKELQGLTILLVDDDADAREFMAELLTQCGCLVLTAASASDALVLLDEASPRVLISDIGMPGVDGYAFIEAVRNRPPDRGGTVVAAALTAYASIEDKRRALSAGFQMHLVKPIHPAELVAALVNLAQLSTAIER